MPVIVQQALEQLDVVNDRDEVIGSESRATIHASGLKHRATHILVFSGTGQLLMQKRSMAKDECAGNWDSSCAGHVESGANYLDTAVRELQEELGITATTESLQPLFTMSPNAENGWEFARVYRLQHDGPFTIASDEIDRIEWVDAQRLEQWASRQSSPLTEGFVQIWTRYQAGIS